MSGPEPEQPDRLHARPRWPWLAFLGFSFGVFLAGGLFFGWVLLGNIKFLSHLQSQTVDISLPSGERVSVAVPRVQLPSLPVLPVPSGSSLFDPQRLLPVWRGTERIAILILGIDRRPNEQPETARTDTMLLLVIDPVSRGAAMISFPRDLWVSIPGRGEQRINVAHALGGPALAKQTIEQNFGVRVQYYARVDFVGFEEMIDTLGGVIVDVERPIRDDEYPTRDYGLTRIYISPGPQHMDGARALQYARSRHSEDDFGRIRRQQRLLLAARDRAFQLNMLPKVPSLIGVVQQAVTTDLTAAEILPLARLASEIQDSRIQSLVIDTRFADPMVGLGGASLLRPRSAEIRRAVADVLASIAQPDLTARIEVLNGTDRDGLATSVADLLAGQGFEVARVGSAGARTSRDTVIVASTTKQEVANRIAASLNLPRSSVRSSDDELGDVEVRVLLGSAFTLPP